MDLDVQKGNIWKRISALLLDLITVSIAAVLFAVLFSLIFDYDGKLDAYEEIRTSIEEEYDITFATTEQEYNAFDAELKARYDAAYDALNANDEAVRLYLLLNNVAVLIVTFSLLLAILIFEFILPLILKHGRTLGKRVFGLAVMRNNFVKVSGPVMFIRAILGKYAIETMIPAFILIMFVFGKADILMMILLALVPIVNIVLIIATKNNCPIHDLIAMTVVVDFESQKIFETEEEMIAYKTAKHEEAVREGTAAYHDFQK